MIPQLTYDTESNKVFCEFGDRFDITEQFSSILLKMQSDSDAAQLEKAQIIFNEVCAYFEIDGSQLRSNSKFKEVSHARYIAMYLVKKHTTLSLSEIGSFFNRDHSAVWHASKTIFQNKDKDVYTKRDLENLSQRLNVQCS